MNQLIPHIDKLQGQFTSGANAVTQRAAIVALTGDLRPSQEMNEEFTRRRARMMELLKEIPGIECAVPEGAFYVFPVVSQYFGRKNGDEVIKDEQGNVTELHCSYIPESKSGHDTSGINVKGTLHWVSVKHAITAEVRLYDRLFKVENPSSEEGDFKDYINPDSLQIVKAVYAEPALMNAKFDEAYQFIRKGYFVLDKDSSTSGMVFNKTVGLKDAWAKESKKT